MGRLEDKVAVVTGGSSGIGRAVLTRFAGEGARVVAVGRNAERLAEAQRDAKEAGGDCAVAIADLATDAGVAAAVNTAVREFGGFDVLVNNAGVGYSYRDERPRSMDPLETTPPEDWDEVMSINLGAMVRCIRRAIPVLRDRGGGSIVNVASILGLRGHLDGHAYTAAKGAMINLTRSIATAHAKEGIRCNVVCPGFIETPMVEQYIDYLNSDDYRFQWNPMGRMGKPEEVANGCLFFASDESAYCTGSSLVIDGGTTAKLL